MKSVYWTMGILMSSKIAHTSSFLTEGDTVSKIESTKFVSKGLSKTDDRLESIGRQLSITPTQAFINNRILNTSVALTFPIFSFTLPQAGSHGSPLDLANQAIYGLFFVLVSMLVMVVPALFTGIRQTPDPLTGRDLEDGGILRHNSLMDVMSTQLQKKLGLDGTKCLQKTICQAYRSPGNKYYGLFALPFQIFFPPKANETLTLSKPSSIFRWAAREGKYSKEECGLQFPCLFDVLDLAMYLVEWYKFSSGQNRNEEDF